MPICIVVHEKGHISEEDGVFELKEILLATFKMLGLEILEIVDKTGKFTGEILEKDLAHSRNLFHNGIVILIVNEKKRILLQKRSSNRKFSPNKWEMCGGHVNAYEKLETAAKREVLEELGLEIEENEFVPLSFKECSIKDNTSHIFNFYFIKSNLNEKNLVIQKEELSEVKWFTINEVIEMIKLKNVSIAFNENRLNVLEELQKVFRRSIDSKFSDRIGLKNYENWENYSLFIKTLKFDF